MLSPKSILGIDLRVTSVKVVELKKSKGKTILANWGMTEIPFSLADKHPQKEDAQADALKKLIEIKKIKTKDAAIVLGGSDAHVRIFTLSEISEAEVADVIKWKLAEEIPFSIEEALIDFYPLSNGEIAPGQKKDYVAACIHINVFREVDYIIRKAGLKLVALTILPNALQKVFKAEVNREKGKIISLIYMGKRTTNISIFKGENLEFNRELNIGGEEITLAMSGILVSPQGRIEINPEEAEKIKLEHGIPLEIDKYAKISEIPLRQLRAMVQPALERVQNEITHTFEYYKGQTGEAAIDKIIITGGSSMTINLANFLSEGLGIPVVTADIMENQVYDEKLEDKSAIEKVLPRLSAAIGAALVGKTKINLLPEEIKRRFKTLIQRSVKPQYLVPIFAIILMILYGMFWLQAYNLQKEINNINQKLKNYEPRIAVLGVIERERKAEEKRTKISELFRQISQLVSDSVLIDRLMLKEDEVYIQGTTIGIEDTAENNLSRFISALSVSEYFQEVKLIQAVKNYDHDRDAFNFEIVTKIKI